MPFMKGQSGNPGGRPKAVAAVQDLARKHTPDAIRTLVGIMGDEKAAPAARVAASNAILDRGWGKPPRAIAGESGEGPIVVEVVRYGSTK